MLERVYLKMEKRQSKKLIEYEILRKKVNNMEFLYVLILYLIVYNNYFIIKINGMSKKLCLNNNVYNIKNSHIIIIK
jgi:hypothetical protein